LADSVGDIAAFGYFGVADASYGDFAFGCCKLDSLDGKRADVKTQDLFQGRHDSPLRDEIHF
jgi:hypothetical protein